MKILMINGSPKKKGNTARALEEMEQIFVNEGFEVETVQVGHLALHSCLGCGSCGKNGRCVFEDVVNETAPKFMEADGIVVGTPVHYANASGALMSFLQRLFYSTGYIDKRMKVGACFTAARRAGTTATFEEVNKFFTISQMPIASGSYWNDIFGCAPGEADEDEEGLQNARRLARNMVFLIKSIALGKEKYGLPETEKSIATNFIR